MFLGLFMCAFVFIFFGGGLFFSILKLHIFCFLVGFFRKIFAGFFFVRASIVHASTSGESLDPRALALVPWAHQIIELRTLIGAKGMETLSAGREPVPRFAVTWAKLRTQRAEIDRALRDRAAEAPASVMMDARAKTSRHQPWAQCLK